MNGRALKLINCSDLTQYSLFIIESFHSGKMLLNFEKHSICHNLNWQAHTQVSFAKRQAHFLKKIGIGPVFLQESNWHFKRFTPDSQKRVLFWSKTLKIRACSGKKFKNRDLFWISGSEKSTLVGGTYPYT